VIERLYQFRWHSDLGAILAMERSRPVS